MRKALSEIHYVGQIIAIDMQKPEYGKIPIGRTDTGAICLIQKSKNTFIEYGSTWSVEVVEVHEKKLIVAPLNCEMSAAANSARLSQKLQALSKPKVKKEKVKFNYQYDRKG